ncbi:hypothetical protein D3C87_1314050 [compost metagenome]
MTFGNAYSDIDRGFVGNLFDQAIKIRRRNPVDLVSAVDPVHGIVVTDEDQRRKAVFIACDGIRSSHTAVDDRCARERRTRRVACVLPNLDRGRAAEIKKLTERHGAINAAGMALCLAEIKRAHGLVVDSRDEKAAVTNAPDEITVKEVDRYGLRQIAFAKADG